MVPDAGIDRAGQRIVRIRSIPVDNTGCECNSD